MGWNPSDIMPWHTPPARDDGRCDTCGGLLDEMGVFPRRPTLWIMKYRYHAGCNAYMDRTILEAKKKQEVV